MSFTTVRFGSGARWGATETAVLAGFVAAAVATLAAAPLMGTAGYMLPVAVLAGLAGLVAVFAAVTGSRAALITLVFFATCGLDLSFRVREIGETGLDWQNGIKFASWAIMLVVGFRHHAKILRLLHDPAMVLLVAYCCFCLASALWSPVPAYTGAAALGSFAWLSLAIACVLSVEEADLLRTLMWALGCECVIGLCVAVFLPDIGWLQGSEWEGARLAGLSGHPNLLGQHAALLLIVVPAAHEAKPLGRLTTLAFLGLAILVLALTGSRTAIIAVAAAFYISYLRHHLRLALASAMVVVTVLALILVCKALGLLPNFDGLMSTLSRSGDASEITTATHRAELWSIAWGHFVERPFLGWGFNGTEKLMADSVEANFAGGAVNAHNVVLQALMSLGLVGSITVFGYFAVLLSRFLTRPDGFRDRLIVFLILLGFGEAEFLSIPVLMSFLVFWCVARDAALRYPDLGVRAEPLTGDRSGFPQSARAWS